MSDSTAAATSSIISGAAAQTQASTSGTKLTKDLNSFLTLLTSQLKNQDPLSPMDSTQFTNQLTQFAQVEQQININSNLASLLSLTQQNIASNVVNYIGKTIEGPSAQAPLEDGALKASYSFGSEAKTVTVAVKDADGGIVYSQAGDTSAGVHEFNWDGKDSYGVQQKDGTYTLEVTAIGADGTSIDTATTIFGKVTGVTTVNNVTTLLVGTIGIPVTSVMGVTDGKS